MSGLLESLSPILNLVATGDGIPGSSTTGGSAGRANPSAPQHLDFGSQKVRRQNQACDPCRSRKVRCQRQVGADKCQHCLSKHYECTNEAQLRTSEKRRNAGYQRVKRSVERQLSNAHAMPHGPPLYPSTVSPANSDGTIQFTRPSQSTLALLTYLFSPPEQRLSYLGGPSHSMSDDDWGDIGNVLRDESFRRAFTMDLVDVYFQICHIRMPLVPQTDFLKRLNAYIPANNQGAPPTCEPLPPALLATVIAWGAKFSEHPDLLQDRDANDGRSRVCPVLVRRAREIAEAEKVHRIPSPENVITALLLEPLQSQEPTDQDGYRGFWLNCAIRHMFEMQVNRAAEVNQLNEQDRNSMTFAWWVATLQDAHQALYWRKKPYIDDDDSDLIISDSRHTLPPVTTMAPDVHYRTWEASLDLACITRDLARHCHRPSTQTHGLPLGVLKRLVDDLREWRNKHLSEVGVPLNFAANWDFIAAVTACTIDAEYHIVWVILQSIAEEFGIQSAATANGVVLDLEDIIKKEALDGALRVAGLVGVLTSNNYLRLDPNTMQYSTFAAGMFLARSGRPETESCIKGLNQCSIAYEEMQAQAIEMERAFEQVTMGVGSAGMMTPPDPSYDRNGDYYAPPLSAGPGPNIYSPIVYR